MRVIGGKWKSRKINEHFKLSHNKVIRPTSDRVKENIFNILESLDIGNPIVGAKVLDIFCGTGAMGIEAISRGCKVLCQLDVGSKASGRGACLPTALFQAKIAIFPR